VGKYEDQAHDAEPDGRVEGGTQDAFADGQRDESETAMAMAATRQ
jgi:hypothetical protein